MDYQELFEQKFSVGDFSKSPLDRASQPVKEALNGTYYIDVHGHFFDIKCINKAYFIIRMIKDFVGLKSANDTFLNLSVKDAYREIDQYDENWEDDLKTEMELQKIVPSPTTKGVIDYLNAMKFLSFKKMKDVYEYYESKFSLKDSLGCDNVMVTALIMDLEMGWDTKITKTLYEQITELKELSKSKPILPFLACDPRRVDRYRDDDKKNIYSLFNYAFTGDTPFFGVKIYPALGYDPSDYRLWPIYKVCEEYGIPVLSHCGGESVSTASTQLDIFEGDIPKTLNASTREDMAYKLNDPARWFKVLEKFPNLRLNLAHFGGYQTWSKPVEVRYKDQTRKETIFELMAKYPNVYADFSFNLVEVNLSKTLREVLTVRNDIFERTMFGTDYWVVNKEGNLLREQIEFLDLMEANALGKPMKQKLTIDNPRRYLGL